MEEPCYKAWRTLEGKTMAGLPMFSENTAANTSLAAGTVQWLRERRFHSSSVLSKKCPFDVRFTNTLYLLFN